MHTTKHHRKTTSFATLAYATLVFLSSACGAEISDSERERRQDLAFDLSGTYEELSTQPQENSKGVSLSIENERGYHDIILNLQIERPLTEQEQRGLERAIEHPDFPKEQVTAAAAAVAVALTSLELGRGEQNPSRGGENVVLDANGRQSESVVYSNRQVVYTWKESETRRHEVRFRTHFYFTAARNNRLIDFSVTRDTDTAGQHLNKGKGLWVEIQRTLIEETAEGTQMHTQTSDSRPVQFQPFGPIESAR